MIIPGILEKNFESIKEKYELLKDVAEIIQIDIADGDFVDNLTFGNIDELEQLEGNAELEIHFMINDLYPYTERKIQNVSRVCIHIESATFDQAILGQFWILGYEIGICLNPETNIEELENYLNKIDYVQFMTVRPGKQGNEFESSVLNKIKEFKQMYPDISVQVDGGVDENNLNTLLNLGVDNVVIGSRIFNSEDPKKKFLEFQNTAHGNKN